ncbi:MAG: nicotinamide mononucleotide transporter [Gammaproteobacteria bacterium CG22_combo_CG10-13_8_21_14_all_40_8]|nr:MAG: nicotinamide mononucleotide transporter [Gammaproteobacteria bacterium CG22_combo_CG10-13_8_21_14_all_40_8]
MDNTFINKFSHSLLEAFQAMNGWEVLAVVFALLYLWLAMKQNIWCWFCGFASTAIYLFLFWKVSLLSESLLQIFYLVLSVYGWLQWGEGKYLATEQSSITVISWSAKQHFITILSTLIATAILGFLMDNYTSAQFPYIDGATSTFAVVTTYMVTRKVLENWIYWIVIDSVSIFLYSSRGLHLTALLFTAYVIMCFYGYSAWKASLAEEKSFA